MRKTRHTVIVAAVSSLAFLGAGVCAFAPAASAASRGNSANAHACQGDGYEQWRRSDGSTFRSSGECTSYAARRGTLVPPTPVLQEASMLLGPRLVFKPGSVAVVFIEVVAAKGWTPNDSVTVSLSNGGAVVVTADPAGAISPGTTVGYGVCGVDSLLTITATDGEHVASQIMYVAASC